MSRFASKVVAAVLALAVCGSTANARFLTRQTSELDAFIEEQRVISLQGTLNNIGPDGSKVPGAGAGYVVASPSKVDPDYFYTWSRDSALTLKMIIDEFILGKSDLQRYIEDYIRAQAVLQTVTNPSGTFLPSGVGLGEPKYGVNGTRFNGSWGRPQRDGPALRAIALITYSNWLIANDETDKAKTVVWPVISNDLSYVGQYWNSTGFDLWEEVNGSAFFTTINQYRALLEGKALAGTLGLECTACGQAAQVGCFLQQAYWNGEYFIANINVNNGRSGKDANTMLGSIAVFDIQAACDDPSIQPCNSRALSSFKAWVDAFRDPAVYPINEGIPSNKGIAVGRYTEDVYFNGNPWYLITAGAAEFLYDAVAQWRVQGALTIDETSLSFFQDIYPESTATTYASDSTEFAAILQAVANYADSFVDIVRQYTPEDGALAEQFNKNAPFEPISAVDLTWSYAAFVTMAERRAGEFPPSWVAAALAPEIPTQCSASSIKGTYAPATAAGAPDVNATCTSTVLFQVNATTYFGENLLVTGNSTDLGAWDYSNSWPLDATGYTDQRPLWQARLQLTAGQTISYGYVRQENCGQEPIFESANRTIVVPPCDENADPEEILLTTDDAWTGPFGSPGAC